MFSDYKAQVVNFYKKKRDERCLPLNLINPTSAKLKNECLLVFQARGIKRDIGILRQFFGHKNDENGYLKAIKTIDTDKFKPLANFLKEQTQDTEDKNIELLAWLLDFNPRPFQFSLDQSNYNLVEIKSLKKDLEYKSETIKILGDEKRLPAKIWDQNKSLKLILTLFIVISFFILFNIYMRSNSFLGVFEDKNQCMYWSNNQYVSIHCNEKMPQTQIIALDQSKIKYFKKITRPDTLTIADINRVWYSKINKVVELYTSPGKHPLHTEKQLKPLSKYMFNKYVITGKIGK